VASVLLTASPALAHANLDGSIPADQARVRQADRVRLMFDEPVQLVGTGLQVRDPDGRLIASQLRSARRATVEARLPRSLAKGVYTVGFVFLSADGDVSAGSYQFTITSGTGHSSSSRWRLVAVALAVLASGGLLVAIRRRSRPGTVGAGLVLAAAALLALAPVGERSGLPTAEVSAEPAAAGLSTLTVRLPQDDPVDEIDVHVTLVGSELTLHVPVVAAGRGVWRARDVQLPAGGWRALVSVRRGGQQQLLTGTFDVADG
jgi:methionine-rich copper-binding protein CopC